MLGIGGNLGGDEWWKDYFRLMVKYEEPRLACYFGSTAGTYWVDPPAEEYNDGNWHHIALVAKENEPLTFYFDGEALPVVADQKITPFLPASSGNFYVGSMPGGTTDVFQGGLDDLRIYDRVLTAEEVAELYALKDAPAVTSTPAVTSEPASSGSDAGETSGVPSSSESGNGWVVWVIVAAAVVVVVVVVVIMTKKKK